ncbi:MAG: OmpA family protein, partial [Verrucomicrobiota bacterium]
WEPYTTLALANEDAHRLIDSSQARGVILDIAIASRKLVAENPEIVQNVARAYFDTLGMLGADSEKMLALAMADSNEDRETTQAMLRGVAFQSIAQNAQLSGLVQSPNPSMVDLISGVREILIQVGDLPDDPIPGGLSVLTNRQFVEAASQGAGGGPAITPPTHVFRPLSENEWSQLNQQLLGTLIDRPITFPSGQARIPDEFQPDLEAAASKLKHYPTYRVIVQAHVSEGSDPAADMMLSQERAEAIRDYLVNDANVAANRIRAMGMGAIEPVEKREGESLAAWKRRCRRAKIFIAEDS